MRMLLNLLRMDIDKTCVTICQTTNTIYINHSRFNPEHNQEGLWDFLEEKENLHFELLSLLHFYSDF